jgi:PTH1 family peptidyl-tRNA hydrolase
MAVEAFAGPLSPTWSERWSARVARVSCQGEDVLVLEPQTFMNLSGHAVSAAARFFRIELKDVLVVHDDVDLPLGRLMLKAGGGDAGHKGIRSILEQFGSRDFARLRVGVGRPSGQGPDVPDYVLAPFHESELEALDAALEKAVKGIREWVVGGVPMAQNRVNRRERPRIPSCPETRRDPGPKDREEVG